MKHSFGMLVAVSLGLVFTSGTPAQDSANRLNKTYRDESHCLIAPEIRSDKDKPASCYCRDAITDARYVVQTYLLTGKDQNLFGTALTLESVAMKMCGEGYNIYNATRPTDWRWNGPEVTYKYPTDSEIHQLTPDSSGFRTVPYELKLTYRDTQGHAMED